MIDMDDDRHRTVHCSGDRDMPMIDVYAAADLFPAGSERSLGEEFCMAILRAEGIATPGPFHLNDTAAYIHRMDSSSVQTAATACDRTVRVQVVSPPAALSRTRQKQLVKEVTEIVAKIAGDPTQAGRTWVLLTEAAEVGWGISGTAFGGEEFAVLAAKARGAGYAGDVPPAPKTCGRATGRPISLRLQIDQRRRAVARGRVCSWHSDRGERANRKVALWLRAASRNAASPNIAFTQNAAAHATEISRL